MQGAKCNKLHFALFVLHLALHVSPIGLVNTKVSPITRPIVNQLIRCSSSVASNYRAATRSRSDAEFFSKICIVVEEVDETQFWLDYLARIKLLEKKETSGLFGEVEELVRLFTSIKSKMKAKLNDYREK